MDILHSMGLNKCILTYIYHYSIIQISFIAQNILFLLPIYPCPSLPRLNSSQPLIFSCLHSFIFSRLGKLSYYYEVWSCMKERWREYWTEALKMSLHYVEDLVRPMWNHQIKVSQQGGSCSLGWLEYHLSAEMNFKVQQLNFLVSYATCSRRSGNRTQGSYKS